ncbi:MAG: hypothetical protein N3F07_00410 [Candidatus Micrarchaeota archaeon]|nr:hypothetical protein [Candidatus Micrarchaeota archaeon]
MELSLIGKKENKALGRHEILCEVSFEKSMPSRKQLREAICAAAGVSPELLVVVSAKSQFGSKRGKVVAHAYKDKKSMEVERKHLLVRDGLMEKEKKSGKKAPAQK